MRKEEIRGDQEEMLIRTSCSHRKSQDSTALVALLKACAKQKDLTKGTKIHGDILRRGLLDKDICISNALVNMYANCGALAKAQELFHQLPARDVVSWNGLLTAYVQHGHHAEAVRYFEQMQRESFSPDAATFVCILKACGCIGAIDKGREIHAEILREGLLEKFVRVGNALVDMYAKCGALAKARQVFDKLQIRDVVTWNVLISGYAQQTHGKEALDCLAWMRREGFCPNVATFVYILKACGSIKAADKGKEIHAEIVREGLVNKDILVGNALIDMYAKCGALLKAQEVFDELPHQDLVSWNTIISGYSQHGQGKEALNCFEQMQRKGFSPDAVTFVCILKACGSLGAASKGQAIHAEIAREGLLESNMLVGTALLDMYAKCGMLEKSQEVFDNLRVRNVVTWNALIAGYAQLGHGEKALNCFDQMQCDDLSPNAVTFLCILKACGSIGAADKGKEIHAKIIRGRWLEKNILLGTALVDMYAKCGMLTKSREVFDELQVRDAVSWNVLIAGYAQHDHGEEVFDCLEQMQNEGLSPSAVTFVFILKACGIIGAVDKGRELHDWIIREGLLRNNMLVGTALLDMYAKCGAPEKAQVVFDELPTRDVVCWTLLIAGYAQLGKDEIVFETLSKMIDQGIQPNLVTFSVVLNSCSCSGELDKGQFYFETMTANYGIMPTPEHYTCMVDLFGRADHFDKAVAVIKKMATYDCLPVWSALLAACQKWGNARLGRWAFKHAVELDEKDPATYVSMHNIYAATAMQEEADKVEALRVRNKAWKNVVGEPI